MIRLLMIVAFLFAVARDVQQNEVCSSARSLGYVSIRCSARRTAEPLALDSLSGRVTFLFAVARDVQRNGWTNRGKSPQARFYSL